MLSKYKNRKLYVSLLLVCFLVVFSLIKFNSVSAATTSAPRSLGGSITSSTSITLTWLPPAVGAATVTDYLVEYKLSADSSWTTFTDGVSTATTTTVTGLTNGSNYDFRISAINIDGTSTPSYVISIVSWVSATGGTVTEVGGYRLHTFTSSSSISFQSGGSVETLIVGGGGGGGTTVAGGGGAGGVVSTSTNVSSGTLAVTVGGGGAGGVNGAAGANGSNGATSTFNSISASGGGAGAGFNTAGSAGASGGGTGANSTGAGGTAISGQGFAGGTGASATLNAGGGGGGAGGVGGNGLNGVAGNGGTGVQSSITGTAVYYGGGGGGGSRTSSGGISAGVGGNGGGGAGGISTVGYAGTANTGGGGGGGGFNGAHLGGGNGGSGIIIIRYPVVFSGILQVPVISSAVSNTQKVTLVWSIGQGSSPQITDFKIEYKLSADSSWTTFTDGVSTATTTTVTGLTNGQSYDFRISSINSSSATSDPSDTVTVTPNVSVPSTPQNIFITVGSSTRAILTWDAPVLDNGASTTDYLIEYKLSADSSWTTFTDGVSTATTTTVTGLLDTLSYDFRVSAINSVGTSSPSSTVTDTPGYFVLVDNFDTSVINTSKWTEFDAAVGGSGGSAGNVQQSAGKLSVTGNSAWGQNGLQSNATFSRSFGDVEVKVTMTGSCTVGTSFNFGYGDINFGAAGTYSYIISKAGSSWTLYYFQNGSNSTSVPMSGIPCTTGNDVTLRMVALQAGGVSVFVGTSTTPVATVASGTFNNKKVWLQTNGNGDITTFDNLRVSEPLSLPLAPGSIVVSPADSQVDLSWVAGNANGSTITDYQLQYKLPTTATWTTFSDSVSTSTTGSIMGLTNGIIYNFRVVPISNNGTGTPSVAVSSAARITTLAAPTATSVSILGTPTVDETLRGYYLFADPNGDIEGSSTYRWLVSNTAGGTYTPISGAISNTYVVTSNESGKYLKFEVTPVSSIGPYVGSAVLSSSSLQVATTSYINHILSTGQSLSVGWNGTPALTTTQPYSNKMLTGGSGSTFTPLIESSVESMSSSLGNSLTYLSPNASFQSAVTMHGIPSYSYSQIKKGTSAYTTGMTQTTNVFNAAAGLGKVDRVIGVTVIHGETDNVNGNGLAYEGYLHEWQTDYDTDVRAITGQSDTVPMFTDQTSSHTGYGYTTSLIPVAQLAASEDYPGMNILVAPKYFLTYVDGGHLNNVSYRWLGEYYAKVMKKVVIDKETWRPLSPDSIVRNGNTIYAKFHVPAGPLVIDTTNVLAKSNYGFEYYDTASTTSISSVSLINSDTVKIVLNGTPTGSDQRLRYAYTGVGAYGTAPGAQSSGSARGNLRDSDPAVPLYATTTSNANNLYNWTVQFDKPITDDTTAPSQSNISSSPGVSTSTITWFTNENSDTQVEYGTTSTIYTASTTLDSSVLSSSHGVTLTGLSSNTTYYYRVISRDIAQNRTNSSEQTFTTSAGAPVLSEPSQVTSVVAATSTPSQATITFATSSSDGGSSILYYTASSTPGGYTATSTGSPIIVTGLTNGTAYTFTVTATNAIGVSALSTASNSVTPLALPDTTPPTVSITAPTDSSTILGSTVTISADSSDNVGVVGVQFYRDSNVAIGSEDTTSTYGVTFDSTAVSNGSHTIFAVARDVAGNYATSTSVTVTVDNPPTPVTQTLTLDAATSVGTSSAIFNVTVVSDGYASSSLLGFEYGTTTSYGSTLTLGGSFGVGSYYNTAFDLIPNTTYHFRAYTTNSAGTASSSDLTFTTLSLNTTPSAITASPLNTSATITWITSDPASSQVIFGLTTSYGSSTTVTNISPRVTSHGVSVVGLTSCTLYHYQVSGTDVTSVTSTSSDQTFVTTGCSASAPITASNEGSITTSAGGTLTQDQITITVPTGFTGTSSSAVFQAHKLDGSVFFNSISAPTGLVSVGGNVFNLKALTDSSTLLTTFDAPITVVLSYSPSDITGVDESTLWIYRYDGSQWYPLSNCTTDTGSHTVTCETSNFSDFSIFGESSTIETSTGGCSTTYYTEGNINYQSRCGVVTVVNTNTPIAVSSGSTGGSTSNVTPTTSSTVATSTQTTTVHTDSCLPGYLFNILTGQRCQTTSVTENPSTNTATTYIFSRNLKFGSTGEDVRQLQIFLNFKGFMVSTTGAGSVGKETDYFGPATRTALIKLQKAKNIKPSIGYFGPITRGIVGR
ncbi:MAG: fibronectin type III domain-containing protein [Candidatus Pacebacteria bacterium]|nr:fibronectin type III domain-containing protein [Candidatus Paceibacterota bacterium]